MNDLIAEFNRLASAASYHYADDSCAEWSTALDRKQKALEIFDANPELQAEIRRDFHELWSLKKERPE